MRNLKKKPVRIWKFGQIRCTRNNSFTEGKYFAFFYQIPIFRYKFLNAFYHLKNLFFEIIRKRHWKLWATLEKTNFWNVWLSNLLKYLLFSNVIKPAQTDVPILFSFNKKNVKKRQFLLPWINNSIYKSKANCHFKAVVLHSFKSLTTTSKEILFLLCLCVNWILIFVGLRVILIRFIMQRMHAYETYETCKQLSSTLSSHYIAVPSNSAHSKEKTLEIEF